MTCHISLGEDIVQSLNQFWQLEQVNTVSKVSQEEKKCVNHFHNNTRRDNSGRFIVRLPTKLQSINLLGDSYEIAKRQFLALEKRLLNNPKIHADYIRFLNEYLALGHMREVERPFDLKLGTKVYYMPHHPVIKESSTTTKLRVVFNASCKTTSGISLNDALMVGPNLQQDLVSIFTRFRTFVVALVADVEKMYH